MTPKHTLARLDMSTLRISSLHYDHSSPSPLTSPSVDSSDEEDLPFSSKTTLRSSIAELPDSKLRAILVKLADTNPRFQRAIMKEVACARVAGDSPPMPASQSPKARKSKPRQGGRNPPESRIQLPTLPLLQPEEFVYHPGHLDEEVYEFLPHMPHETVFSVMRTIKMWSCCDEDEWSPGCRMSSSFTHHLKQNPHIMELSHCDVFPDSDLERQHDEAAQEALAPPSADDF